MIMKFGTKVLHYGKSRKINFILFGKLLCGYKKTYIFMPIQKTFSLYFFVLFSNIVVQNQTLIETSGLVTLNKPLLVRSVKLSDIMRDKYIDE